ncbi:MAG: isoprenylcysteine carboxylmethyltransferase family protein [Candidatus Woesearchaeota archaeon]
MVNMIKVLVAVTVLLIIIGIALLGKKIGRALIFKTAKTPSNESIIIEWITGILVVGLSFTYYIKQNPEADITMWIGVIVYFAGWMLQLFARKQLYEDATFEKRLMSGFEAAQMGLYAHIRHPSKTALLLIMIGLCFALGSIWALAVLVFLFLPALLYRISCEERALMDQFGDRWMTYREDTKRIIPKVL